MKKMTVSPDYETTTKTLAEKKVKRRGATAADFSFSGRGSLERRFPFDQRRGRRCEHAARDMISNFEDEVERIQQDFLIRPPEATGFPTFIFTSGLRAAISLKGT